MKNVNGFWLTDAESHLEPFLEKGPYQELTRQRAVEACDQRRVCLDIGAHCGLWSRYLVNEFRQVVAFEPVPAHRRCFERNVKGNYVMCPVALGDELREVYMHIDDANTGHTHVAEDGLRVWQRKLDEFEFEDVDFIKIDCEGYEYYVCLGGKETILRNKPVLCVEQKPHGFYGLKTTAAVELLESWGAVVVDRVRADYILKWN